MNYLKILVFLLISTLSVLAQKAPTVDGTGKFINPSTSTIVTANNILQSLGPQIITGNSDAIQLLIKGNSAQGNKIFEIQNSSGTDLFDVDNSGNLTLGGTITGTVQLRNSTYSSISATTLAAGEPAFIIDGSSNFNHNLYIGDGSTVGGYLVGGAQMLRLSGYPSPGTNNGGSGAVGTAGITSATDNQIIQKGGSGGTNSATGTGIGGNGGSILPAISETGGNGGNGSSTAGGVGGAGGSITNNPIVIQAANGGSASNTSTGTAGSGGNLSTVINISSGSGGGISSAASGNGGAGGALSGTILVVQGGNGGSTAGTTNGGAGGSIGTQAIVLKAGAGGATTGSSVAGPAGGRFLERYPS